MQPNSGIWLKVKTLKETLLNIRNYKGRNVIHKKFSLPEEKRGGTAVR